jgi:DNA polymerase V
MPVIALSIEIRTTAAVPLASYRAAAGFPSPAEDHLDRALDFNELLVTNVPATFVVRVTGDSMTGVGIMEGDYAVVNRAVRPTNKAVVVALVDGEFTLKRLRRRGSRTWLQAENPAYRDIDILDGMAFEIWGVVTGIVRKF